MSYLDELDKMSVSEFCKQAFHRIDGITMYLVCIMFTLVAAYLALADWLGWPSTPEWEHLGSVTPLLLVPITFLEYTACVYYSTPGALWSRLVNSAFLLAIPSLGAYKFNLF